MQRKNKFYKYTLKLQWPAVCRNRSVEILKDRPDLVDQIEKFRKKIDNVTKIICRDSVQIDGNYLMSGVNLWFVSGQDAYEFIIRQPEFEWEITHKLGVLNELTNQLQRFDILYKPTGIQIN